MRPDLTEIAFVLDRSGSMNSIAGDAIGGFNTFLAQQQGEPGEAHLTLVLFDHEYLVTHDNVDIHSVPPLDASTYVPRGMTALLDAIGRTIDAIDIGGTAASAKITLVHGNITFIDYFVLLKTEQGWKIANKAFHAQPQ